MNSRNEHPYINGNDISEQQLELTSTNNANCHHKTLSPSNSNPTTEIGTELANSCSANDGSIDYDQPHRKHSNDDVLSATSKSCDSLCTVSTTLDLVAGGQYDKRGSTSSRGDRHAKKSRIIIRKFQKLDQFQLSSTPSPDVKIGQRVAYKEYYGSEFGTIRWIGRVPQICPDWTAGVEFDNAIGEGDGSLNGRRYFIAKDCFAKFLPLNALAFVDQHVGRPEPGTMISVMSASVRPGQMISIQRVSTVHVQHCFLNAPHQIPGADILAVNTRLHCQCPNCGPCAHVIKPPRTQRLSRSRKNATHMCQFSTYTCCGMQSQEEATCTYTGNKIASFPSDVVPLPSSFALPPIGNSWIEGAGYLTNLQAQQSKIVPQEYKLGAAPEDIVDPEARRIINKKVSASRRGGGRDSQDQHHQNHKQCDLVEIDSPNTTIQNYSKEVDNLVEEESRQNIIAINMNSQQKSQAFAFNNAYFDNSLPSGVDVNSNSINSYQTASAGEEKTALYTENDNSNWTMHKNHDYNNTNNINSNLSTASSDNSNKQVPKSAKVVYRDSIENRYLFPTDDLIDSTLEADLENLSQARYGPRTTNYRLNGSKNIFKSLRSLVSCLSAQSNHSELDRHSESTLRFSEYGQKSNNKSVPVCVNEENFSTSSSSTSSSQPPSAAIPEALSKCQSIFRNEKEDSSPPYIYSAPPVYDDHIKNDFSNHHNNHHHQIDTIRRQMSSSSDCGFSSASQNSINFITHSKLSPLKTYDEERKRNQIYKEFLTQLVSNTSIKNEDLLRLKRAMFEPNFGNCCLHKTANNIHNMTTPNPLANAESDQNIAIEDSQRTSTNFNHSLDDKRGCEQKQYPNSNNTILCELTASNEQCKPNTDKVYTEVSSQKAPQDEITKISRTIDGSSISGSLSSSCNDSLTGTASSGLIQPDNSPTDGRSKQTSETKQTVTSGSLPQAFELKLTLTINSEAQKAQLTASECCIEPSRLLKPTEII